MNAFTTWDKASIKFLLLFKADFNLMVCLFFYGWGKHRANGIHRAAFLKIHAGTGFYKKVRFWPHLLPTRWARLFIVFFMSLFIISGVIISCRLIRCTFSRFETRDEWPPVIRLKIHMGKLTKHFFCLLMTRKNKLREYSIVVSAVKRKV